MHTRILPCSFPNKFSKTSSTTTDRVSLRRHLSARVEVRSARYVSKNGMAFYCFRGGSDFSRRRTIEAEVEVFSSQKVAPVSWPNAALTNCASVSAKNSSHSALENALNGAFNSLPLLSSAAPSAPRSTVTPAPISAASWIRCGRPAEFFDEGHF